GDQIAQVFHSLLNRCRFGPLRGGLRLGSRRLLRENRGCHGRNNQRRCKPCSFEVHCGGSWVTAKRSWEVAVSRVDSFGSQVRSTRFSFVMPIQMVTSLTIYCMSI